MPNSDMRTIFRKYLKDNFIETGCYMGRGIQAALDVGFKKIYSIELSDRFYDLCSIKFKNNPQVKIIKGDSATVLGQLLSEIKDETTFWLDGHFSGEGTARGLFSSPLLEELRQIKDHDIKTHTIIVDDLRCWSKNDPKIGFDAQDIKKVLLDINPSYHIAYECGTVPDDIIVAVAYPHIK